MTKTRVNVRTAVNSANIRKEERRGREVIVIPSATMPDDIVMNGIFYPADEIEKSYHSLERTIAPLGHPATHDGAFLSAFDPEAINLYHVGAYNEKVMRVNGRVWIDKVVDVQIANSTEGGRRLLAAIEKGEPIHTSTGLYAEMEDAPEGAEYYRIAHNITFDHDAILLDEVGAATPEQGVGLLVNGEQIEVVNSTLEEDFERDIESAAMYLAGAMRRKEDVKQDVSLAKRIIEAVKGLFPAQASTETAANEADMTVTKEQFDALAAQVTNLADAIGKLDMKAAFDAAIAPIATQVNALAAAETAKVEAAKTELVNQIVKANILTEDEAKELTVPALNALAKTIKPGTPAPMATFHNAAKSDYDWAASLPKE